MKHLETRVGREQAACPKGFGPFAVSMAHHGVYFGYPLSYRPSSFSHHVSKDLDLQRLSTYGRNLICATPKAGT